MYAKIENGVVAEYPVAEYQIKLNSPSTSFPEPFQPIEPYVRVDTTTPPSVAWDQEVSEGTPSLIDGAWRQTWIVSNLTSQQKSDKLRAEKNRMLSALAARRWREETGGITINGVTFSTDASSQMKYIGALIAAQMNPSIQMQWKLSDGYFITIDARMISVVANSVRLHVQRCFEVESEKASEIESAGTHEELSGIDIHRSWPGDEETPDLI